MQSLLLALNSFTCVILPQKREMRSLWITRITAGSRQYGVRLAAVLRLCRVLAGNVCWRLPH